MHACLFWCADVIPSGSTGTTHFLTFYKKQTHTLTHTHTSNQPQSLCDNVHWAFIFTVNYGTLRSH